MTLFEAIEKYADEIGIYIDEEKIPAIAALIIVICGDSPTEKQIKKMIETCKYIGEGVTIKNHEQ